MGNYILNMAMVAIMTLPFVLIGSAIVDFLHTRVAQSAIAIRRWLSASGTAFPTSDVHLRSSRKS